MRILPIVLSTFLAVSAAAADELPRRAMFGAQVQRPAQGDGAAIGQVLPGTPAEAAKLMSGDVVVRIDDRKIATPDEFVAAVKQHHGGDDVQVEVVRGSEHLTLPVHLTEPPRESSPDYDVIYDSVRANGALRRTIITKPHGDAKHPAVLFAGGIGCYSLDGASAIGNGYISLLQDLTRRGFVVMRVEKSGMGDSQGVPCMQQDFENELAGYRAGLAQLRKYDFVDPQRVFFIGHSIGGLVAPVLASESKLRGVVALSTAGHKWIQYEDENGKRQLAMEGKSGDELRTEVALHHNCLQLLLIEKKTPDEVLKAQPACDKELRYPAHYTYMQQVAALDPPALWKKVSAPVLLIHGGSDFVTDAEEHRVIEHAVNSAHPGHATFIIEPHMDHFMRDVPSREASMRMLKDNTMDQTPLQTKVRDDIAKWLLAHS